MPRAIVTLLAAVTLWARAPAPAAAEVTAEQVREAIDRAVSYLRRQQLDDGSWGPDWERQPGGVTALCTLALLEAGVPPEDSQIQKALAFLRRVPNERTYVVSLKAMVFAKASPQRDGAELARIVAFLEKTQIAEGDMRGAWSYPGMGGRGDNSNSQFALLALHEAERVGVKVENRTWQIAREYWQRVQNPDGSWGYWPGLNGTGSMTAAGIASLVIASGGVQAGNAKVDGDRIQCCLPGPPGGGRPIDRGLAWLGRNFAVGSNPGAAMDGRAHLLYYLYGVERVGRMTAHRFIGRHDWYREGAEQLLRMKGAASDQWVGPLEEENPLIATSFALLFLAKGRRPVLLSKLNPGSGDDWNLHQSDVNNLTRYVESRWKRDLTWQVIELKTASVEDLLESPVLYLCGRENPAPQSAAGQDDVARKLRDYLDRGGFLFAEADCGGAGFDRGFRALMDRVFPEQEYRLVPLPPEHPIWRTEEAVEAKHVRTLWGVEFGCRTSVVYSPPDPSDAQRPSLSCLWELARSGRDQAIAPEAQGQIKAGLSIGINVLAYATNRELKFKDPARPQPVGEKVQDRLPRGRLTVANIRHMGGCDAAPRALTTLLETAQRQLRIRVGMEPRDVRLSDDALFDLAVVFMHGRNDFHLSDLERQRLRTYVERGGVVFANAICASRTFSESFRREMEAVFPDHPLRPIPKEHPMFTTRYGGFDLAKVRRRDPQRASRGEPLRDTVREVPPELEGVQLGDRYGVIFSPYDLSCALEKHDSLECQGYVRDDAARIGLNVLLYCLQQ